MSRREQPYLPLYVMDFLTDEKLVECSAESTGVYIRLMCLMHKSEQYGAILLKQKDKQTGKQIYDFACKLMRQMPYDIETIARSLTELLNEGVLSMDGDVLFQRRMVRDGKLSDTRASAGKRGGQGRGQKNGARAFASRFASDFAQAKTEANAENEIEIENESEIEDKSEDEDNRDIPKEANTSLPAREKMSRLRKYGQYGWVKLTDDQYERLQRELGDAELQRCIDYIDESAQITKNKNKWRDWNLVIRKCSRDRWGLSVKGGAAPGRDQPHSAEFKPSTGFRKAESS